MGNNQSKMDALNSQMNLLVESQAQEIKELKEANDTFTLGAKRTIEKNCKLYEENKKLKEEIQGIPALLEEERYKERACNERDDADALEMLAEDNEELKKEIEKLEKLHEKEDEIVERINDIIDEENFEWD